MTGFMTAGDVSEFSGRIVDCRFSLADNEAGEKDYAKGHVPGAGYLNLDVDMSGSVDVHGGRHPLPSPQRFAATLARLGIDAETDVLLYDDSRYAFAARCWWMMRSLGFRPPKLLSGGYSAWLASGGRPEASAPVIGAAATVSAPDHWPGCCDRGQLAALLAEGAVLVDAREALRYRGEQEPIDPVAGHIPGAINLPWQGFSDERGVFLEQDMLRSLWGDAAAATPLVVYCGSGVSACVNILSLAMLGREDVWLYGGSWSDWCSYL